MVYGYVVRGPLGGFAWHHLQYVTGLIKLGHDVLFVEDGSGGPDCFDPLRGGMVADPSYGLTFMGDACNQLGIGDRWAYRDGRDQRWYGPRSQDAVAFCAGSDLLINLNDPTELPGWLAAIPVRALIDTDPVFMQIANLSDSERSMAAAQHTAFFTFGEGIPAGWSTAPRDGFPWQPTRQPIDVDEWHPRGAGAANAWTTVMQWESYPAVVFAGVPYGMKSATFGAYEELPSRTGERLEMALGSSGAPREKLRTLGWTISDPLVVSRTLSTYRNFIVESKGEFSVAKHGYVAAESGWFSERTACYLAAGRPAIVQDTGFSRLLPCGEGLMAFSTPQEALAALEDGKRRYERHCEAARGVAHEYFHYERVLSNLVDRAMSSPAFDGVEAPAR